MVEHHLLHVGRGRGRDRRRHALLGADGALNDQLDDGRVERRAARGHAPDGGAEVGHLGDPVLQQVADVRGAVTEQVDDVLGLRVLRQDQHADGREPRPDLARRPHALVGVGRRHADVDHRHVGRIGGHRRHQLVGVAARPTTSRPASASTRATPSRISSESSAITTRSAISPPTVAPPARPRPDRNPRLACDPVHSPSGGLGSDRDRLRPGRPEGRHPGREAGPEGGARRAPPHGRRRLHEHRHDPVEDAARGGAVPDRLAPARLLRRQLPRQGRDRDRRPVPAHAPGDRRARSTSSATS